MTVPTNPFRITTEARITEILGEPPDFVRAKVADHVDEWAAAFVALSPLVFVGTVDRAGNIDVSPKGDDPGFVHLESPDTLLIPERKGNNLAFGPRNTLATGRVGLVFVVPGLRETLRINGAAGLTDDPGQLARLSARGKPALLCTEVHVEECFFHCGKAMIRAQAWNPASWAADDLSPMVAQVVASLGGEPSLTPIVREQLEQNYVDDL